MCLTLLRGGGSRKGGVGIMLLFCKGVMGVGVMMLFCKEVIGVEVCGIAC